MVKSFFHWLLAGHGEGGELLEDPWQVFHMPFVHPDMQLSLFCNSSCTVCKNSCYILPHPRKCALVTKYLGPLIMLLLESFIQIVSYNVKFWYGCESLGFKSQLTYKSCRLAVGKSHAIGQLNILSRHCNQYGRTQFARCELPCPHWHGSVVDELGTWWPQFIWYRRVTGLER